MNFDAEHKQQLRYLNECVDQYTLPTLGKVINGTLTQSKSINKLSTKVYDKEEQKRKLLKLNKEEINKLYTEQKQKENARAEAQKQVELERYNAWYPANKEIFEYWARQKFWRIEEGILLILGKEPCEATLTKLQQDMLSPPYYPKSSPLALFVEFEKIYNTAARYIHAGDLQNSITPVFFLSWVKKMGYSIPPELLDAINSFKEQMTDWEGKYKETEKQCNKLLSQVNELSSTNNALKNKLAQTLEGNKTLSSQNTDLGESSKKNAKENQILKERIEKLEKEIAAMSLSTITKNTYLKLILGMAIDKYNFRTTSNRNDATGTRERSIYAALEKLGDDFHVSDDTIRNILQEATEMLG
jgi:hypothetical protein